MHVTQTATLKSNPTDVYLNVFWAVSPTSTFSFFSSEQLFRFLRGTLVSVNTKIKLFQWAYWLTEFHFPSVDTAQSLIRFSHSRNRTFVLFMYSLVSSSKKFSSKTSLCKRVKKKPNICIFTAEWMAYYKCEKTKKHLLTYYQHLSLHCYQIEKINTS